MINTQISTILATTAVMVLTACGGTSIGGGGDSSATSSNQQLANYSTLKVFTDGAGVARGLGVDGSHALVITPDVTLVVKESNSVTESDLDRLEFSDFPIVQQLATNANVRVGAYTVDGITANVTAIEDLGGEAGLFLIDIPNYGNLIMAAGTNYRSSPLGVHSYNGTVGIGRRSINSNPELGAFTLSADFTNSNFSYNGSTTSNTISATGLVDIPNGRFTTNSMTLNTSGIQRTGTMYGQFHGTAAASVSGVFHTSEANPVFIGAFVGSR